MSTLVQMLRSSLGRKYLMGLTGLGLSVFLLVHMSGNLLIFAGPEAYNLYAYTLTKNKMVLFGAEAGLLAMFGIHILCAWSLQFQNWGARAHAYAKTPHGEKGVSAASQSMIATGALVAFYVIIHLWHLKFGTHYTTQLAGVGEVRDMYRLVEESFRHPGMSWLWVYSIALLILLVHLKHGVASALQSLGFVGPKYRDMVQQVGIAYAVIVVAGFLMPPMYLAFIHQ